MRAESIEQIREHLARGGRVMSYRCDIVLNVDADGKIRYESSAGFIWRAVFNKGDWELLPIEEEKVVEDNDDSKLKPCPFCGGDADSMTYCGNDTIFCQTCPAMMGGEESRATREELAEAWNRRPIEEEKPKRECYYHVDGLPVAIKDPTRDSQKERMQRIRQSLLFGHYPSLDDLRAWWQATTGERIEWGRRCNACECSGEVTVRKIMKANCPTCNGRGYTVRPTWMGEVKG